MILRLIEFIAMKNNIAPSLQLFGYNVVLVLLEGLWNIIRFVIFLYKWWLWLLSVAVRNEKFQTKAGHFK